MVRIERAEDFCGVAEVALARARRLYVARHADPDYGEFRFELLLDRLADRDAAVMLTEVLVDVLDADLTACTGGSEVWRESTAWRLDHSPGIDRELRADLFARLDFLIGGRP